MPRIKSNEHAHAYARFARFMLAIFEDSLQKRFWAKVDKNGPVPEYRPELGPCWLWTAAKGTKDYGVFKMPLTGMILAHIASYMIHNGFITAGNVVDHLCRVHSCVNPAHLESVTHRENLLRGETQAAINAKKTHCNQGHLLAGTNLLTSPSCIGHRSCRECANERARKRLAKKKQEAVANV